MQCNANSCITNLYILSSLLTVIFVWVVASYWSLISAICNDPGPNLRCSSQHALDMGLHVEERGGGTCYVWCWWLAGMIVGFLIGSIHKMLCNARNTLIQEKWFISIYVHAWSVIQNRANFTSSHACMCHAPIYSDTKLSSVGKNFISLWYVRTPQRPQP